MKIIRWILGRFVLVYNALFAPSSAERNTEDQAALDALTSDLTLYHLPTCPFCMKVRRAIKRHGLEVELRDITGESAHRKALVAGGGRSMVPCLRIEETQGTRWMYESSDIVDYLENHIVAKIDRAA